jgi:predicted transposase YbfD/YdcC
MKIEVSIGEIVDKLSILKIKKNNITDESKLFNVITEYDYLYDVVFNQLKIESDDFNNLLLVNESLWKIEDDIRDKEQDKVFDTEFIELARSVYTTNDKRAEIKKKINLKYGSLFVEEKSYSNYC